MGERLAAIGFFIVSAGHALIVAALIEHFLKGRWT